MKKYKLSIIFISFFVGLNAAASSTGFAGSSSRRTQGREAVSRPIMPQVPDNIFLKNARWLERKKWLEEMLRDQNSQAAHRRPSLENFEDRRHKDPADCPKQLLFGATPADIQLEAA